MVTFTRAAAAEMKQEVRDQLLRAVSALTAPDSANLEPWLMHLRDCDEAELNLRLSASRNVQFIDGSGLGTCAASKSGGISVQEVVIDGVFGRFPLIRDAIESFSVGFIVAENQFLVTLETESIVP